MPPTTILRTLSDADVEAVARTMLTLRQMRVNAPAGVPPESGEQNAGVPTYVVKTPEDGIPAADGDTPGRAECDAYQTVRGVADGAFTYTLEKAGHKVWVSNTSGAVIDGDAWLGVTREAYSADYLPLGTPALSEPCGLVGPLVLDDEGRIVPGDYCVVASEDAFGGSVGPVITGVDTTGITNRFLRVIVQDSTVSPPDVTIDWGGDGTSANAYKVAQPFEMDIWIREVVVGEGTAEIVRIAQRTGGFALLWGSGSDQPVGNPGQYKIATPSPVSVHKDTVGGSPVYGLGSGEPWMFRRITTVSNAFGGPGVDPQAVGWTVVPNPSGDLTGSPRGQYLAAAAVPDGFGNSPTVLSWFDFPDFATVSYVDTGDANTQVAAVAAADANAAALIAAADPTGYIDSGDASTLSAAQSYTDSAIGAFDKPAKVAAPSAPTGHVELSCDESSEAWFSDVVRVPLRLGFAAVPLDPIFLDVCEPDTIVATSACPSVMAQVGARVECGRLYVEADRAVPLVTVRVSGIQRGRGGLRFPGCTKEDVDRNRAFWAQAHGRPADPAAFTKERHQP